MSCVDKRSVCLRVTHHHRRLTGSCESVMDEADREVSSLTDRAFRSLCVGDEAVYNDTEFAALSPSPIACLLKPLADEHSRVPDASRKNGSNDAPRKNGSNGSNGAATGAWQHRDVSSFLSAFTSGKNGESAKIPNGMLGGNSMESWDASALRSIQRELAEFSTDFQQGLVDGSFANSRKQGAPSENKSAKKSVKGGSAGSSSGKSSKSKHSKSSKLKKLNSRNFFLHSEFSPFQAWKDLNQFPFGQESISDLLPSDTFPRWCDTSLYRHLSLAPDTHILAPDTHTLAPDTHILAPGTHTLSPSTHTLALAHTSEPSQGPHKGQRSERSQKPDTTRRSQHAQRHNTAPKTEHVQNTDTVQADSKQTLGNAQGVGSGKDIEAAQRTDTLLGDGGLESTEVVQKGASAQAAEGSRGAERLQGVEGPRPVGGRSELLSRSVEGGQPTAGGQSTSVPEHGRSSDNTEFSAPWRRNRGRARSAAPGGQLEKGSPAADRPPTGIEPPRRQEVRRMEGQNSANSTPFNITHLLTPIIPCRQETESLDPAALPALFSPATLDLPTAAALEPKASPEMKARESYRSIASSLLFNLKDNRKRVKAMYSPPRFRPSEPTNHSKPDGRTTSAMGTPVLAAADGSPVIESTSALLLPGNQVHSSPAEPRAVGATPGSGDAEEAAAHTRHSERRNSHQLSVTEGLHPGSSPLNRSPLASRPAYPCLNLYKKASPSGDDLSPWPAGTEGTMETQDNHEGQSDQPVRKVKETPKKSVKDRVKEFQGQNTETQGTANKSPAKRNKESQSVCTTGLPAAGGAVDKGADREEGKGKAKPPEVPPKPILHKPENPKPAKQPPPVPARIRYPPKAEKDSPEPRQTPLQRDTNPAEDPILTFSARQNSFIKSQRSFQMEEEEGEEWDELREVALLKEMKAELEARQGRQQAESAMATDPDRSESTRATEGLQHTGSSLKAHLPPPPPPPPPPPRGDIAEPGESSGAKNRAAVAGQEQAVLKQNLSSPLLDRRARKGILSLRGNTLAKRDMFATMEQSPTHTSGSRSNRKENTTFTRYDLATMALEEVIADRKERERRGQGTPAEMQGGAADTRGSTLHPEQRAETTQCHDPQGRLDLPPTAPPKPSVEGRRGGTRGQKGSTDNTHSDRTGQSKTHSDRTGQAKTHTDKTGQAKTHTDKREQGKGGVRASERVRGKAQESSEKKDREGDRTEWADRERAQRSRTPPPVPSRKSKPVMRGEEPVMRGEESVVRGEGPVIRGEEKASVKGIRAEAERQAGADCNSREERQAGGNCNSREERQAGADCNSREEREEREHPAYVGRKREQRGDDDIRGLRETHERQQEAHTAGGEGNRQDGQLALLKEDKQKSRAEETNGVISQEASGRPNTHMHIKEEAHISQEASGRPNTDMHTKEAHKAENQQQHTHPAAEVQTEPSSKQSIQSEQSSKQSIQSEQSSKHSVKSEHSSKPSVQSEASSKHSVKSEHSSKQSVQSEASSKQSPLSHKPSPKVEESPNSPQVQAAGGVSPKSEREGEAQGRDGETPGLKSPKVKPSKSYMRDFLSLLGLASDDRDTDEHTSIQYPESPDGDTSIHYPASPDLPSPVVDSITVHDMLKSPVYSPLQSPVYSPLQSPVYSPLQSPVYSPLQSPVYSPLQSPIRSSSSHSDDSQRRPGQERRRWGGVAVAAANVSKEDAAKAGLDDCTFSNPGSEADASERLVTSPLSDLDKGGWVRSLIEQAQSLSPKNMTPKDLTPVSLTPSQSNASSPTPAWPILFKVKDNTFVTSPVTKTVRPVLHKSIQDMQVKPWSPREGLGGSDRGSDRGSEKGSERAEETPECPREVPGIPLLVETASSPLPERSHPTPPEGTVAPAPHSPYQLPPSPRHLPPSPRQPPQGQMLEVPEQERGGSVSSGLSEGYDVSSGLSEGPDEMSVGEGSEEAGLGTAQPDEMEDSKAPSERSGSVCSGTEASGQGRKPPPAVLPKTEKAMKRAMKLTTRRMQKAEKKSRAHRHHRAEENTEPTQADHRAEVTEPQQKNRSEEHPQTEQRNCGSGRTRTESERKHHTTKEHKSQHTPASEQTPDKSEQGGHHSNSSHSGQHGDRKGRGGEKHARVKHEQKSISCHRDARCHESSQKALEQRQASVRDGPGNGNHGDRRSKSLERDLPLPHEGLQHHWDKPHTGSDITAAESSRGTSRHTVFNGLLARQNSSEHAYPPSTSSLEHAYPPPNTEHAYPPSTSSLVPQSFPLTQRKLLQDPDSGQYFVVDMPVQVKTKTFFDPETGSYVQLPVQSGEGAVPQAPSVEVLNPSLVVYHGFMPMPVSSLPQHKATAKPSASHLPLPGNMEDVDNAATQWLEHSSRSEHPYIEPVYAPKDHTPEEELDSVR